MMPGDYIDHPEWDPVDVDQDDFNTAYIDRLDAMEPADDYNGEFEHSEEYPDINGMDSDVTMTQEEDDDREQDQSSFSSAASSTVSGAAHAASAVARSFAVMATGAVVISSSYTQSMAMRTSYYWDREENAFYMESPDGREEIDGEVTFVDEGVNCTEGGTRIYTVHFMDEGELLHVGTYTDEVPPLGHEFVLESSEGEDTGSVSHTYICDRCGAKLSVDAAVESHTAEDNELTDKSTNNSDGQDE